MSVTAAFRRFLADLDVAGVRRLWRAANPGMPQPESDEEALVSIHMARTAMESIELRSRAYSHAWLRERGLPSLLSDELRPRAERMYPVAVTAVGIGALRPQPYTPILRGAAEDAVLEAYADRRTDPEFVRARMREARVRARRLLHLPPEGGGAW